MKYKITKKECQKNINNLNHVCDRCGRKLLPIKTVDNAKNPTYWIGCFHGQTKKGSWGHFTSGVKKEIYDLAVKLVLEDSIDFGMKYEDRELGDFDYAFQNAVYQACGKIRQIECMKNNKPRYSKFQLKNKYFTPRP